MLSRNESDTFIAETTMHRLYKWVQAAARGEDPRELAIHLIRQVTKRGRLRYEPNRLMLNIKCLLRHKYWWMNLGDPETPSDVVKDRVRNMFDIVEDILVWNGDGR